MRSLSFGRHIEPRSAGSLQVRDKASGGTLSSISTICAVLEYITLMSRSVMATFNSSS